MAEAPVIRIEIDGFAPDAFSVVSFRGSEAMSTLFRYSITLASANPTEDFDALLEAKAHLILGDPAMHLHGMLCSVQQGYEAAWKSGTGTLTRFDVVLVPNVWALTLTNKSRVFQKMTSQDIVKKILNETGIAGDEIEWKVSGSLRKRDFILQYDESDFDFCQRLLEDDGIHFHFRHEEEKDVMVFGNKNAAFQEITGDPVVKLGLPDSSIGTGAVGPWGHEETHTRFQSRQRVVPKTVTLQDYNYSKASLDLKVSNDIKDTRAAKGTQYFFGEDYLEPSEGKQVHAVRGEEILARKRIFMGVGTVRRLYPGGVFSQGSLDEIASELAQEYVVTELTSEGSQPVPNAATRAQRYHYENEFTCIPKSVEFRPERRTPWPEIAGVVHAKICAPSGAQYAHIDDKGRYKVKFMFDLEGKEDETSSCWVRLAEPYAGASFGFHLPMLHGHEVIVAFENGDPNRPVIVGGLYNSDNVSPTVDANNPQSIWRSAGQNEIRFDDTKGEEHVYLHGTKDWQIKIENDKDQKIGNDETLDVAHNRTTTIHNDQSETVDNNKSSRVGANHAETIGANQSITVGSNKSEEVAINSSETVGVAKELSVGGAYQISVGAAMNTTVGAAKGLEVGGNQTVVIGGNANETVGKTRKIVVKENSAQDVTKEYSLHAKKKILIESDEEITLKAGKAMITLKKDGTILVDGKDITAKASGAFNAKASKDVVLKGSKVLAN